MIEPTPVRKEVRIQFLQDTKQTVTTKFAVGDRVVTEVLGNNLFTYGGLEVLTFDAFWIQARVRRGHLTNVNCQVQKPTPPHQSSRQQPPTRGGRMIETTPVRKEVRIQFLQDTKQTVTFSSVGMFWTCRELTSVLFRKRGRTDCKEVSAQSRMRGLSRWTTLMFIQSGEKVARKGLQSKLPRTLHAIETYRHLREHV